MASHFLDKAAHGVATAGKIAGIAKGAYDVGKTLYTVGSAVAPYVGAAARTVASMA